MFKYHVDQGVETRPNRKYKKPYSTDSKAYSQQYRVHSLLNFSNRLSINAANTSIEVTTSIDLDPTQTIKETPKIPQAPLSSIDPLSEAKKRVDSAEDESNYSTPKVPNQSTSLSGSFSSAAMYNQNITRLLEEGERINLIYRCARVQGLDTTEGVFLFGKEHFYVLDGYTLGSNRDIIDIESLKGKFLSR